MLCALVFWPWALYNVLKLREDSPSVHGGIDFGILSFPFLFFAGLNGLTSIRNPHITIATKHAMAHVILTAIAHTLVTINYIAGGIIGKDYYSLYCYVAAVVFAITGVIFTYYAWKWKLSFEKMTHAMSLNMY